MHAHAPTGPRTADPVPFPGDAHRRRMMGSTAPRWAICAFCKSYALCHLWWASSWRCTDCGG
jgi:hypothetical protein